MGYDECVRCGKREDEACGDDCCSCYSGTPLCVQCCDEVYGSPSCAHCNRGCMDCKVFAGKTCGSFACTLGDEEGRCKLCWHAFLKRHGITAKDGTHSCTKLMCGHLRCDLLEESSSEDGCEECDHISAGIARKDAETKKKEAAAKVKKIEKDAREVEMEMRKQDLELLKSKNIMFQSKKLQKVIKKIEKRGKKGNQ